ncbi:DUF992 domain-containing protein [Siculibacillus lacustris]|nr:DUF992 domain-containing protein [Siculibacillus lacustris]
MIKIAARRLAAALGVASGFGLVSLPALAAPERVEIGVLRCRVATGDNFLAGSNRTLRCLFEPADGRRPETYDGEITRIGVEIGEARNTDIRWMLISAEN